MPRSANPDPNGFIMAMAQQQFRIKLLAQWMLLSWKQEKPSEEEEEEEKVKSSWLKLKSVNQVK